MNEWIKRSSGRLLDATIVPLLRYTRATALAEQRVRDVQAGLRKEIEDLRKDVRAVTPDNPCAHGFKVYSQVDEDGIVQNIFARIPDHSRTFVEIGCGNGVENNTHAMALQGYRGCWVDGSEESVGSIRNSLGGLRFRNLLIQRDFVSTNNVGSILGTCVEFLGAKDIGLFALDIDGNDLFVLSEALKHIKPQVICVEYNAKFPPPISLTIRYEPKFCWLGDDYHGASLQAYCDLLVDYKLVSCSLGGANAFFVREDIAHEFSHYTPSELYQPLRLNLMQLQPHHAPTLKWLRNNVETLGSDEGKSI